MKLLSSLMLALLAVVVMMASGGKNNNRMLVHAEYTRQMCEQKMRERAKDGVQAGAWIANLCDRWDDIRATLNKFQVPHANPDDPWMRGDN